MTFLKMMCQGALSRISHKLSIQNMNKVTVPMNRVVLSFRPSHVWKPLGSKRGPLQSVCHHQIIQKRSVLLPYLVLLIDHPLFNRIIKSFYKRQKLQILYEVFFDNQKITGCQAQASAKNSITIGQNIDSEYNYLRHLCQPLYLTET